MAAEGVERVQALMAEVLPAPDVSVPERRRAYDELLAHFPPPTSVTFDAVDADGVPGFAAYDIEADLVPVTLYLHGGAYGLCSVRTHANAIARIASASGGRVLSINYRLAPEHPFPAAVEDTVTAYRWLLRDGIDPAQVVVVGDSAGSGLALALLTVLREAGEPFPAGIVAICPWVDLADHSQAGTSLERYAGFYLNGADPANVLASPINGDFGGFPPLLIEAGGADGLLAQSERLAEKASAAGVDVELNVWPDMIHVWHLFAPVIPDGARVNERIGSWVRARAAS